MNFDMQEIFYSKLTHSSDSRIIRHPKSVRLVRLFTDEFLIKNITTADDYVSGLTGEVVAGAAEGLNQIYTSSPAMGLPFLSTGKTVTEVMRPVHHAAVMLAVFQDLSKRADSMSRVDVARSAMWMECVAGMQELMEHAQKHSRDCDELISKQETLSALKAQSDVLYNIANEGLKVTRTSQGMVDDLKTYTWSAYLGLGEAATSNDGVQEGLTTTATDLLALRAQLVSTTALVDKLIAGNKEQQAGAAKTGAAITSAKESAGHAYTGATTASEWIGKQASGYDTALQAQAPSASGSTPN